MLSLISWFFGLILTVGILTIIAIDNTFWQLIIIAAAIAGALISLPFLFLTEPVRGKHDSQESKRFNWADVREVLASRNYVALLLLDSLNRVGQVFFTTWLAVFMADESGLEERVALYSGVPAIIPIVLCTYPLAILTDRIHTKRPRNGRLFLLLVGLVR